MNSKADTKNDNFVKARRPKGESFKKESSEERRHYIPADFKVGSYCLDSAKIACSSQDTSRAERRDFPVYPVPEGSIVGQVVEQLDIEGSYDFKTHTRKNQLDFRNLHYPNYTPIVLLNYSNVLGMKSCTALMLF